MNITLERTRIIIEDYDENDRRKLERMVSTQDKIFFCVDEDYNKIYVAPGLIDEVKKKFPKANFTDKSKESPAPSIRSPSTGRRRRPPSRAWGRTGCRASSSPTSPPPPSGPWTSGPGKIGRAHV